jgi:regulator of replication initiation timing
LCPVEDPKDLKDPQTAWNLLQKRIDRLLETVTQLRKANAEIMKENVILANQARPGSAPVKPSGVPQAEYDHLKRRLDEALTDLSKVRDYVKKVELLMAESGQTPPPMGDM